MTPPVSELHTRGGLGKKQAIDLARVVERFLQQPAELHNAPRLIASSDRRVLWASPAAQRMLRDPLPLTISGGQLQTDCHAADRSFTAFIDSLNEGPQHKLLRGSRGDAWIRLKGWREAVGADRAVFLECIVSLPLRRVEHTALPADFGLTPTECLVLNAFARLARPPQIAEELNVSLSTVRSHLKQIHAKMGVSTSLQLLQLTRSYCDN